MQVCLTYSYFHFISMTKAYSLFDERVSVQYVPMFVVDFEIIPYFIFGDSILLWTLLKNNSPPLDYQVRPVVPCFQLQPPYYSFCIMAEMNSEKECSVLGSGAD